MNKWLNIRRGTNMKFYNSCSEKEKEYILKREILNQVTRKNLNLSNMGNKSEKDFRVLQVINRKLDIIKTDFQNIDKELTELNYIESKKEAIWKVWLGEITENQINEFIDIMYYSPNELLELTEFSIEEWW